MDEFDFSFLLPTRGRPESLPRLCANIREHTSHPDRLEIIFVMDSDDEASLPFEYEGLNIRKLVMAPGMTMGELYMAAYRVARGRHLMLMNDDVVIRTHGWDEQVLDVFRSYPDGIVLVHVNENIFHEKLCIFPCLTRVFCELSNGICRTDYRRYRIDDHIHNVFDLLSILGVRRRVFLPNVIFEHYNVVETDEGQQYIPIPEIHDLDTQLFNALLPERKRLALAAMEVIDRYAHLEERRVWEARLASVSDSVAIRDPRHALVYPAYGGNGELQGARVSTPVLSGSYRGFNLVVHEGRAYGLRQSLGQVNVADGELELLRRFGGDAIVVADSIDVLKVRIDVLKVRIDAMESSSELAALRAELANVRSVTATRETTEAGLAAAGHRLDELAAKLSEQAVAASNSVASQNLQYDEMRAMMQDLESRLNTISRQEQLVARQVALLQYGPGDPQEPCLAGEYRGFTLVHYRGGVYGLPKPLEPNKAQLTEQLARNGSSDVISGHSLDGVRARIDVWKDAQDLHAELVSLDQELLATGSRLTEDLRQANAALQANTRDLERLARNWPNRLFGRFSR